MDNLWVLIIVIYLLINSYPTIKTLKTEAFDSTKRLFLFLTIWCIPFLGGLGVSLIFLIKPKYDGRYYDVEAGEHGDGGGE